MGGPVVARGELYYQAAAGMLAAVRHGGTAFEQVYGDRFFAYLARHPEQEAVFQGSMSGRAEQEAGDVVAAYDFSRLGRLVDVGGGHGILLGAALRAAPGLRAVLVDQPAVIRMDLHMLVLLGARERTEAQYRRLLAETGFRVERVVPTASVAGLSVIEAVPAD